MITELKKNITKGVGPDKFGYGLYKKDNSGLSFTEETKKKLKKEKEDIMKGKFNFSNHFSEASRTLLYKSQIDLLVKNKKPDKDIPKLYLQELVDLNKKYFQGDRPVDYFRNLSPQEIHRAYLQYKAFYLKINSWFSMKRFSVSLNMGGDGLSLKFKNDDGSPLFTINNAMVKYMIENPKEVTVILGIILAIKQFIKAYIFAKNVILPPQMERKAITESENIEKNMSKYPKIFNEQIMTKWKAIKNSIINKKENKGDYNLLSDLEKIESAIPKNKDNNMGIGKQLTAQLFSAINGETKQETIQFFSNRMITLNFSLLESRENVMNSIRLVFKEIPNEKEAPIFHQIFFKLQNIYLKEKLGSYDPVKLKELVSKLKEDELNDFNTELRKLLKEIRNYTANPNKNLSSGNKGLPPDELNKLERFLRDLGKGAKTVLPTISTGAGLILTGKKIYDTFKGDK